MTAHAPKDRPIIFSAPMVRALLDGRKSQTRRYQFDDDGRLTTWGKLAVEWANGQRDQRVYVRENHQYWDWRDDGTPCIRYAADLATEWASPTTDESAERCLEIWASLSKPENFKIDGAARDRDWRPSIHMPRWASRLTLIVTDVRVQRLLEISEEDAIAEGATSKPGCYGYRNRYDGWSMNWKEPATDHALCNARFAFGSFINELHGGPRWNIGDRISLWDQNPWVVAVSFKTIRANIDSAEARAA